MTKAGFRASRNPAVETTLAPVGVFGGVGITLRKVAGMVHARGTVARASGSSTSYTDCTAAIPAGFLPGADISAPAAPWFGAGAPAGSYQFKALASGGFQVRMSGAVPDGMSVSMSWPAA